MNFDFFGPQMSFATLVPFGAQKVSIHGPNRPRNEKNPPEKIMHGAVKFVGALIVIIIFFEIDINHGSGSKLGKKIGSGSWTLNP